MKCFNVIIALFLWLLSNCQIWAKGDVSVRGYYRSNGTYVRPHTRSTPDGNFNNNWSTKGNTNPYTGKEGTKSNQVTPVYFYVSSEEWYKITSCEIITDTYWKYIICYRNITVLGVEYYTSFTLSIDYYNNCGYIEGYDQQGKLISSKGSVSDSSGIIKEAYNYYYQVKEKENKLNAKLASLKALGWIDVYNGYMIHKPSIKRIAKSIYQVSIVTVPKIDDKFHYEHFTINTKTEEVSHLIKPNQEYSPMLDKWYLDWEWRPAIKEPEILIMQYLKSNK